jgi:DNA-binding response OmpR family regulator
MSNQALRIPPLRILIVEDDGLTAAAFAAALRDEGHHIVGIVDTSRAAIASTTESPADLALVDLNLNDGYTGLRAAQALNDNAVPTVLVSGESQLDAKAKSVHALGFIAKPADAREVVRAVGILVKSQALAPRRLRR